MTMKDLLNQLPTSLRFSPNFGIEAAYKQAVTNGWTDRQLADYLISQVGAGAQVPSAVAVARLRTAAATKPYSPRATGVGTYNPLPECSACGQPYGKRGQRMETGTYNGACAACGEPLVLTEFQHRVREQR